MDGQRDSIIGTVTGSFAKKEMRWIVEKSGHWSTMTTERNQSFLDPIPFVCVMVKVIQVRENSEGGGGSSSSSS